jgi:hypothetical protein
VALGPKEMGEAIVANLKAKTGKDLEEWKEEILKTKLTQKKAIMTWLKENGLGHIQAQTVSAVYLGVGLYDAKRDKESLFSKYPDQKRLMEVIGRRLEKEYQLTPKPCKGYIPYYCEKGTIALSFKPTQKGLYVGLIGDHFDFPVLPHKKSLGGSERMKYGLYIIDEEADAQKVYTALEKPK